MASGPGPRTLCLCTPRLSTAACSRITPCASEPLLARASLHAPLRTPGPPTTLALQALHEQHWPCRPCMPLSPFWRGWPRPSCAHSGRKGTIFPPRLATNKMSVPHYQACLAQPGISRPFGVPALLISGFKTLQQRVPSCPAEIRVQSPLLRSPFAAQWTRVQSPLSGSPFGTKWIRVQFLVAGQG